MSKHTPGPWEYIGDTIETGIDVEHGWFVRVAPKRVISVEGRTNDEALANAHLIAAAPQLMEALELMLQRYGYETCEHVQKSRAALAKARGAA